ncbi:MAG: hypothetical protein IT269_14335 [Saprospiraceae bacterium]|nr:hypothetical protein [Saprospiraceae bacterium]
MKTNTTPFVARSGILAYSGFLMLSILFYKERTAFLDISYHLFCLLRDGDYAIQNDRFVAAITQTFPLTGARLGWSLQHIAMAYSAGFALLYAGAFFVILKGLKNERMALAFLLFNVLMTTHTFYWMQSELPQGAVMLFIFMAMLDNALGDENPNEMYGLLAGILLFVISFAHPLLLFAMLYGFLFMGLSHPEKWRSVVASALAFMFFYGVKRAFFKTGYDTQAMEEVQRFLEGNGVNYWQLKSVKNFWSYLFHDYYFLLIALVIMTAFYVNRRRWAKLLLMYVFTMGYAALVNINYPNGAEQFYLENQYLLLAVFIGSPIAIDFWPEVSLRRYTMPLLMLSVLLGLTRVYFQHHTYTTRLNWLRTTMANTADLPNKKLVIPAASVPHDTLLMTWGSAYEFWLLSTIEQGESRSIIIEETMGEFDWAMPNGKAFITKWGAYDYAKLDARYFIFKDEMPYVKKR